MEFNLGDIVRDVITGFEGKIFFKSNHLFGGEKYAILPMKLVDGKMENSILFNHDRLKICLDIWVSPKHDIKLGDKVEDTITNFKGTVTKISNYYKGDDVISVASEYSDNNTWIDNYSFDPNRLKIIKIKKNNIGFNKP